MVKDIMNLFIGALVGVVFSVLFEEQLFRLKRRIVQFAKRHKKVKPEEEGNQPETFSFGDKETSVIVIDGDGTAVVHNENLMIRVIADPKSCPNQVVKLKEKFEQEIANPESGFSGFNGELFSLYSYQIDRTPNNEDIILRIALYKTDYYTVQAVIRNLDYEFFDNESNSRISLYDKYISGFAPGMVATSVLPNGIGVVATILTRDRKAIFCRRSEQSGFRSGQWDVSVVEGLNPTRDNNLNIYEVVHRAIDEEIGHLPNDKLSINVLGLIFDKRYNQWNFVATAEVDLPSAKIREIRQTGTTGKWEISRLEFVPFSVKDVIKFLKSNTMWDTATLAAYWMLRFHGYSFSAIDKEITKKK